MYIHALIDVRAQTHTHTRTHARVHGYKQNIQAQYLRMSKTLIHQRERQDMHASLDHCSMQVKHPGVCDASSVTCKNNGISSASAAATTIECGNRSSGSNGKSVNQEQEEEEESGMYLVRNANPCKQPLD